MNPTSKPSLLMNPIKSTTSAADRILAEAKRVTEMPPHQVSTETAKAPENQVGKFDVFGFISIFEASALSGVFGHLGEGGYDKLLTERIQNFTNYEPSRDKAIHDAVVASRQRFIQQAR